MILIKHGLREDRRLTLQRSRNLHLGTNLYGLSLLALSLGEESHNSLNLGRSGNLVKREANETLRGVIEVDAGGECDILHHGCLGLDLQCVEDILIGELIAHSLQSLLNGNGRRVSRHSGTTQALGAIIDTVETCHRSHQRRCGADVRRSLLALDMLLAHLERHTQRLIAQAVNRYTDDTAGDITLVSLAASHITCARATEAHRATQSLGRTNCDVGTPLGGRSKQRQREDIGIGSNQSTYGVSLLGKGSIVAHLTRSRGILHQRTELHTVELVGRVVVDDKLDAEGLAASEQHVECLREDILIDEELVAALLNGLARTQSIHHKHSLGSSRSLVQK